MSVTTNQVQKVMRVSRYARGISTFVIVTMLAALAVAMFSLLAGVPTSKFKFSIGTYVFSHESLTSLPLRIYILAFTTIVAAVAIGFVYHLRRVFANLAGGEIFCEANVRNIRQMGNLLIVGGLLGWLAPIANATILAFVGHAGIEYRDMPMISGGLAPFAYGGMLILLSWIMAVGLGVREDAETLRRDAELVI
jgi:hypothetical protein